MQSVRFGNVYAVTELEVIRAGPNEHTVRISDAGGRTVHSVSDDGGLIDRLGGGRSAEAVLTASFRFLLDREPKESILRNFDIAVISRYFPEYESELDRYLDKERP